MKRTVPLLFVCCTILTAVAGFLLPGFLSGAQDGKIQAKTGVYETDIIRFHPVAQMEDSLRLLKDDGHTLSLFQKDGGKRNIDGAHQAALEALRFLEKNGAPGIVPNGYSTHTEMPFLAVSSDNARSAVLWECGFYHKEGGDLVNMIIDDSSGKMLAFKVASSHRIIAEKEEEYNAEPFAKRLSKICSIYFGWKIKAAKTESPFKGEITLTDQSGNALTFPYKVANNSYTFNSTDFVIKTVG